MNPYDHDLERGLRNRRAILGDAWVDKSLAGANTFNADFQNFISRYAWHEVWGRPGLDAKSRRIIVLAITCALGRWDEFELHLRAALTGGSGQSLGAGDDAATALSPDEVKELLIQSAIYAGVPAANTGMAIAMKLLRELGHELVSKPVADVSHPGCGRSMRSAGSPSIHFTVREPREVREPMQTPVHTLVMSHALGCDAGMWDALANALAARHRVICHDHRGHGDSDAPAGPYTMAELADDAQRMLAELNTGPVVWIGLSLGGMVGQELALRHPERIKALVIANSTSVYDEEGRAAWRQRLAAIEAGGLEAIVDGAMQRWFSEAFRAAHPATVARWRRRVVSTSPAGYLGACHAVMNHDTTARLPAITAPTLVIAGALDQGTPVAMSQTIARQVPGARLIVIDAAAHLSALEQPAAFRAAVDGFLAGLD